jgi:hypothetical protein
MTDYRDHIYAALGVPPESEEEGLARRQRRDGPPPRAPARERKLDTPLLTIDDVDQRVGQWIDAEHERMMEILAHVIAHLQSEAAALKAAANSISYCLNGNALTHHSCLRWWQISKSRRSALREVLLGLLWPNTVRLKNRTPTREMLSTREESMQSSNRKQVTG